MSDKTKNDAEYTGELAEFVLLKPLSLINSKEDNKKYAYSELERKLTLLYKHYKIPGGHEDSWKMLALRLAIEHVPGFKIEYPDQTPPKKVGQPGKWTQKEGTLLYSHIHKKVQEGFSISGACKELSLSHKAYKGMNSKSLRQRYNEVKKSWGEEHCNNMDIILKNLPVELQQIKDDFIGSYLPNGASLFKNHEFVKHIALTLPKL